MSDTTESSTPAGDGKYTPRRVSIQLRTLILITIFFHIVTMAGLLILLGNQNQTYRHITKTQAVTSFEMWKQQNTAVTNTKEAINESQKDIIDALKKDKKEPK